MGSGSATACFWSSFDMKPGLRGVPAPLSPRGDGCASRSPDEGDNQCSSVAISSPRGVVCASRSPDEGGNQCSSVLISAHQSSPGLPLRVHQCSSVLIKAHPGCL